MSSPDGSALACAPPGPLRRRNGAPRIQAAAGPGGGAARGVAAPPLRPRLRRSDAAAGPWSCSGVVRTRAGGTCAQLAGGRQCSRRRRARQCRRAAARRWPQPAEYLCDPLSLAYERNFSRTAHAPQHRLGRRSARLAPHGDAPAAGPLLGRRTGRGPGDRPSHLSRHTSSAGRGGPIRPARWPGPRAPLGSDFRSRFSSVGRCGPIRPARRPGNANRGIGSRLPHPPPPGPPSGIGPRPRGGPGS